jgi:hypothetical protein
MMCYGQCFIIRGMEIRELMPIPSISPAVAKELGPENLHNLMLLNTAIQKEAKIRQIDTHLLLVGGNVKPEKQGKPHKDVDLVFYSPQLSTEYYKGGECPKFDTFASFIQNVATALNWSVDVQKPWYRDAEYSGEGKVTLSTTGLPIEILATSENQLNSSFQQFLNKETRPSVVLH